jgi:CheY-like chemotaxis protein
MLRHGLQVSTTIDGEPFVLSENQAVLLFQSARELLLNVVKHAATDQATLRLESRRGELRISVEDEGRGFDSAGLKESATSANTFGLFSIRERMESLGGHVEMMARPKQGTRVALILPLDHGEKNMEVKTLGSEAAKTADMDQAEPAAQEAVDQPPKLRVVLVDDHAMVRQGLRSLLESHRDVEVIAEAGDGLQAVALADSLHPDVVVMDLSLPALDGVEATRRICRAQPGTVVIGLSVHQSRQVEQAIKGAGAAAFLTKDCAVDQLYEAMCSAMMARSS